MATNLPNRNLEFECVHTFKDARTHIKNRIATFHRLLEKREMELLLELDKLESKNRSKLMEMDTDINKLELSLEQNEANLVTNNLVEFQKRQQKEINTKIFEIQTGKYSLDKVCLNWDINETIFERIAEISIFRTRKEERDTIAPLLELEPIEGDTWYVVCDTWFHKWRDSVNLDNSDLTNDDEVMENIPIDNTGILGKDLDSVSITTLHSDAWDQLLCWHGLAEGSFPVSVTTHSKLYPVHLLEPEPEPELRYSYRIMRGSTQGSINHVYLSPTQTFQDLFDVAMKNVSVDKQLITMSWKLTSKRKRSFVSSFSDEMSVITDLSQQIGTDTNLRFHFSVPKGK